MGAAAIAARCTSAGANGFAMIPNDVRRPQSAPEVITATSKNGSHGVAARCLPVLRRTTREPV
jgi:hypothetical protein